MAQVIDLNIDQGTDFVADLKLRNDDNTLIDLTGKTFRADVKDKYCGDVVFSFTFTVKDQITNTGEVAMKAAKVLRGTCYKNPQQFVYDVEMVDPDESVTRLFQGRVILSPEVTLEVVQ